MYVDRATYSFRMSFWTVPRSDRRSMPRASPVATYRASRIAAVALIVMLVLTRSRGRPSRSVCISSRVEIATPTRPTSPRTIGASLSYPIWVGRSNATLSPSLPWAKRYLNRRFVSFAVPNPAYWRIDQSRPRYIVGWMPRVNGNSPGKPGPLDGFTAPIVTCCVDENVMSRWMQDGIIAGWNRLLERPHGSQDLDRADCPFRCR